MITPRLEMITKHIYTKSAADVGTDHAYVPIYLAQHGICTELAATDIKPGPLKIAAENVRKYNLEKTISLRLGGGLTPLKKGEFETLIIAGMGGEVIKNILENEREKAYSAEFLVLQPMNSQDLLRKWLADNDFSVCEEDIENEGYKVYNLIVAKKGTSYAYRDEFELHLPQYLHNHAKFSLLADKKRREFSKIKTGLEQAAQRDIALIEKYTEYIRRIDEMR